MATSSWATSVRMAGGGRWKAGRSERAVTTAEADTRNSSVTLKLRGE